ncbi:hypothetical protein FOL46_007781 [Perkinsus olseni]|uniref:SAP domain-containing protein n=1 Tax=Perkinsus olseni TaxID=32597 RepID=A0A7J6LB94_PEROL|nr:hypothetical protein FOL46_007781 [Perkinsus olseni]
MADLHQQFGAMRVGQLRTLCRQKGIASDGGKRDLVQRLCELADQAGAPTDTSDCQSVPGDVILEPGLSHEELHELATIADEIRHIRKQTQQLCDDPPMCRSITYYAISNTDQLERRDTNLIGGPSGTE